jgi:hypothetical protein
MSKELTIMKPRSKILAVATVALVLPLFASSQNSQDQSTQSAGARITGHREAIRMTRARAELMRPLDAKKDQSGSDVQAKLKQKVRLIDGTELPDGTILIGRVGVDDMQQQGMSKLALIFNQAQLKDGKTIPVKATIVSIFPPEMTNSEGYPVTAGDQVPNSWTDGTLRVDQVDAIPGVDLHSRISSKNSGVFVSTKKDDVKLKEGSEIQFAIGPGKSSSSRAM